MKGWRGIGVGVPIRACTVPGVYSGPMPSHHRRQTVMVSVIGAAAIARRALLVRFPGGVTAASSTRSLAALATICGPGPKSWPRVPEPASIDADGTGRADETLPFG
jgi:hypothetical protein